MGSAYWFARYRRPDGRPAKGVLPLTWQGRATVAFFVAAMLAGGLLFGLIAYLAEAFALGVAVFVLFAIIGAGTFLWAATAKCDPKKSAAEYLAERR